MRLYFARGVFFLALGSLVLASFLPLAAGAQYGYEDVSAYESKLSKLDDEKVEKLKIPILLGMTKAMISPNFGDVRGGGTRTHEGLDIMAPDGAPIVSPTEAVVIDTGSGSASGKYVTTANPGDERFIYMHLKEILVKKGDALRIGDTIGLVGNTGNASGGTAHLHLEIRKGGKATDPYPRLVSVFSQKEKVKYLARVLRDVADKDAYTTFLGKNYGSEFALLKEGGSAVSASTRQEIKQEIKGEIKTVTAVTPLATASAQGDLELGSEGKLVSVVQEILILKDKGPSARALKLAGATGYFGPVTQRALIEYQKANGIAPASGYFGPKTRAFVLSNSSG